MWNAIIILSYIISINKNNIDQATSVTDIWKIYLIIKMHVEHEQSTHKYRY